MISYDGLRQLNLPERELEYSTRDAMLYALSVGYGADPLNERELPFIVENGQFAGRLKALPSLATVVAWDDRFAQSAGIDAVKSVHGEQRITLHKPFPPEGRIRSKTRFVDAFDKGADKGALVLIENAITDSVSGDLLATLLTTTFARGDGGFALGRAVPRPTASAPPAPHILPKRPADWTIRSKTQTNQALFYRLCGDRNPLHADPVFAKAAGFNRPILHGLCTYGIAVGALVGFACDYDPTRLTHVAARFTAPVFPGETVVTEIWSDTDALGFRSKVAERDVTVLDHGKARITGA